MKYGVISKKGVFIPGDERSRTNPGHGYPERTEYHDELQTFDSKEKLDKWVGENYKPKPSWDKSPQSFTVIQYEELAVEVKVETVVKIG